MTDLRHPVATDHVQRGDRASAADVLLDRNAVLATAPFDRPLDVVPSLHTIVLTCCDHRVDPAHVLGIDLAEAVVLRNAGGRVTPDVLASFEVLAIIAMVEELVIEPEMIVMHHTDCGMSRLASPETIDVARRYLAQPGLAPEALHLCDPFGSVLADIQRLRASPGIPPTMPITGIVYDVATGVATNAGVI